MYESPPDQERDKEVLESLSRLLTPLDIRNWQYYPTVGSTNDVAKAWALDGAPDWSIVVADEQTAGRGRMDRKWVTRPGSALAFSLVLSPTNREAAHIPRFTALAALGLINALGGLGLEAQVKWPNDILLAGKKVAGVLVEAEWQDGDLQSLVLGMGVNVTKEAVPDDKDLRYPAISVSQAKSENINRWVLLVNILREMKRLKEEITGDHFMTLWNQHLAFRGQWVQLRFPEQEAARVKILSISHEGQLNVEMEKGDIVTVSTGEIEMVS